MCAAMMRCAVVRIIYVVIEQWFTVEQAHLLAARVNSIANSGRGQDPKLELRRQCEEIEEKIRKVRYRYRDMTAISPGGGGMIGPPPRSSWPTVTISLLVICRVNWSAQSCPNYQSFTMR